MDTYNLIKKFLKSHPNKTILLEDLEKLCNGKTDYADFSHLIQDLVNQGFLEPIKTSRKTIKDTKLYYKYRLHKSLLNRNISQEIQSAQKTYHLLNLSSYYHLSEKEWQKDFPYIKLIHHYILRNKTLPNHEVLGTELSFQLVGDEKWIDEGNGKTVLERLGMWHKLQIQKHPDPLMMAVDITKHQGPYNHLIVENKSTYYALLEELPNTVFAALIYGQGWKITGNINQLEKQLQTLKGIHKIYYFGDLDYEGIAIWYKLNQIRKIHIAKPFYRALLNQKESQGLKNQKRQEAAVMAFLSHFKDEKAMMDQLLTKGNYYPQEAIKEKQLKEIFKTYQLEE